MSEYVDLTDLVVWVVAALLIVSAIARIKDLLAIPRLPVGRPGASDVPPAVSAVVAARDEATHIEATVRGLLAQRDVRIDVRVVDDRSADDTALRAARAGGGDARLSVERVERLPDGWLGKPHACQVGAARSRGEWILFADADVLLAPDVVARAVAAAECAGVEHVCLFPSDSAVGPLARSALLNFGASLAHYAARANRDHPRYFIGIGAFNLVRADAYVAIGGHDLLRMEIVDDLKLGFLLRRAGFRSRAYVASGDVHVHWAPTVTAMIRALEKNLFAMLDFSFTRGWLAVVGLSGLLAAGYAAPFAGGAAGRAAALAWIATLVPAAVHSLHSGWGLLPALLAPITAPVIIVALANSVWSAWRHGGVRWRGTLYPLEQLRSGRVPIRWPRR